jgi:UDPglucose 6-dehydrogenase
MGILSRVISVNDGMADYMAARITRNVAQDAPIGLLGLSFKPGSDDVRDTPAAGIIASILKRGYRNICAYDPVAIDNFQNLYGFSIEYKKSQDEILKSTKTIAILTAWDEFKGLDLRFDGEIIDCRYML